VTITTAAPWMSKRTIERDALLFEIRRRELVVA